MSFILLIHVREAEGKPQVHLLGVLNDGIDFPADVAGRLLDTQQNFVA